MKKILVMTAVALFVVAVTSIGVMATKDKTTDTLKLKQGYSLHLFAVDDSVDPEKVCFQLIKSNGDIVDEVTVLNDESLSLFDEDIKIVEVEQIQVFFGKENWAIALDNFVQYNKATGKVISEIDKIVLIKPYN